MQRLPAGFTVSELVSFWEFATFIREGHYFRPQVWHTLAPERATGGDEVLRRVGFRWGSRDEPVVGVSWYEADAYCRHLRGGRLPLSEELELLHTHLSPLEVGPEWCGDWYNPYVRGPQVRPGRLLLKRVEGWAQADHLPPEETSYHVGFRVVFERHR